MPLRVVISWLNKFDPTPDNAAPRAYEGKFPWKVPITKSHCEFLNQLNRQLHCALWGRVRASQMRCGQCVWNVSHVCMCSCVFLWRSWRGYEKWVLCVCRHVCECIGSGMGKVSVSKFVFVSIADVVPTMPREICSESILEGNPVS